MLLRLAKGVDAQAVLPLIQQDGGWYFRIRGEPIPHEESLRQRLRGVGGLPAERHFVVRGEEDRLLAFASVWQIDWRGRKASVGFLPASPSDEEDEVACEGARAFVRYLFMEENLRRLWTEIPVDAVGAAALLETVGFGAEGTLRAHFRRDGRPCDVRVLALLREGGTDASQDGVSR